MLTTTLFPNAMSPPVTMSALEPVSGEDAAAPGTPARSDPEILTSPPLISYLREASIIWLEIKRGNRQAVRLAPGSMGEPMTAMRTCTEELMTHWGIDVVAHRTLQRLPVPIGNHGNWIVGYQYPTELLRRGMEGRMDFRLIIGPDGKPTDCKTHKSIRPAGFNEVVCQLLTRRARFEPAVDAKGEPIASYWHNSVRFVIPN